VSRIDPVTNTVTATVTVDSGPVGVAFDGTNIWVANSNSNTVSRIRV
jgi:DNA-binding beta-propeller fold protein YncE